MFPWIFIIKVIIGLGMIAFISYLTREMFAEKAQPPVQEQNNEIEVEISTD